MNVYQLFFCCYCGSIMFLIFAACMVMNDPLCRQRTCERSHQNPNSLINFCCCFGSLCNTDLKVTTKVWQPSFPRLSNGRDDGKNFRAESSSNIVSNSVLGVIIAVAVVLSLFICGSIIVLIMIRKQRTLASDLQMRLSGWLSDTHLKSRFTSGSTDSCDTASTRLLYSNPRQRLSQVRCYVLLTRDCHFRSYCIVSVAVSMRFHGGNKVPSENIQDIFITLVIQLWYITCMYRAYILWI